MKVIEIFNSINGEGYRAGETAQFIRLKGCNLNCNYCDTTYANEWNACYTEMTVDEIISVIGKSHIQNVTLTGGEPLIHDGIMALVTAILDTGKNLEIETNGSVDIEPFLHLRHRGNLCFTVDYKVPGSSEEEKMFLKNYEKVGRKDVVKFVLSNQEDLNKAMDICNRYHLVGKCHVLLSTVFGKLATKEVVDYLVTHEINGISIQLQLHKYIWDPNQKGV